MLHNSDLFIVPPTLPHTQRFETPFNIAVAVARCKTVALLFVLILFDCGCSPTPSDQGAAKNPVTPKNPQEASKLPKPDTSGAGQTNETKEDFDQKLVAASRLLEQKKIDEAWKLVKELMIAKPEDTKTLFLAARTSAERGDLATAIALISRVSPDDPEAGPAATGQLAQWLAESGDLMQAEKKLLALLKKFPNGTPGMRLLVRIYNAQGRRWESSPWLDRMIRLGDFTTNELCMTVELREPFDDPALREAAKKFAPDEPFSHLGAVRLLLFKNRWEENLPILKDMTTRRPELVEPWIWYASCLQGLDKAQELSACMNAPPPGAEKHPEYWYIRGTMLSQWIEPQSSDVQAAARCFVEAIRLDRKHIGAHQGLATCLLEMGLPDEAQRMREFGNMLVRNYDLVQQILQNYGNDEAYREIAHNYSILGDVVGEFGWNATLLVLQKKPLGKEIQETKKKLVSGLTMAPVSLDKLDYASWPLPPVDSRNTSDIAQKQGSMSESELSIVMEDVGQKLGVHAHYDNGSQAGRSWYTVEGIGGGVSVLDFDRDGWPDLYFSQAGDSALSASPQFKPKELYRSIDAKQFVEVARHAYVADFGYGQGTGAADIDQDGFRDLLVANLGRIEFYRNQGDGTFETVDLPQADRDSVWNSSLNAADINDDGLPDIVQGCYIDGNEVISRWCQEAGNHRGSCNPKSFPPGRNRILLSLGDGTWQEADADLLRSIRQGYTLGTLITNIDQKEGNDVFFANDVSPNHLLSSLVDKSSGKRVLRENAAAAGVSVDAVGRAQACMGIACGDQNRDGQLDLIVTNFRDEFSTLYLQTSAGVFVDGTRRSGLGMPTLPWVSFGCQLTDLENDGWLDFVAVNGHIDDYGDGVTPWKMPSQVLRNERGHFRWLKSPSPGSYFDGEWIGRGLSALDYNRDGRMDMVATHLDRPAALLENRSTNSNHYLQLELIGTKSEREAVGAIVHVRAGEQKWVACVSAGEGFYGSNEGLVHIGLGSVSQVDELKIIWPDGSQQLLNAVGVDRRNVIVQTIEGM
jgi:tetratricopeptide (TPR) repeat protein